MIDLQQESWEREENMQTKNVLTKNTGYEAPAMQLIVLPVEIITTSTADINMENAGGGFTIDGKDWF